jgi:hypothetical protein
MPTVKYDGKTVAFFVFNQIIVRFGILSEIVTDHGINFQNEMMEEPAVKLGLDMFIFLLITPRKMDK